MKLGSAGRPPGPNTNELRWPTVPLAFRVRQGCSCSSFPRDCVKKKRAFLFRNYTGSPDFPTFGLLNVLSVVILHLQKDDDSVQSNESWFPVDVHMRGPASPAPGAASFSPCRVNALARVPHAAFPEHVGMASG